MDIGVISVRYARALLKAALAAKQEEQVYGEMQTLAQSYVHVPELRFTINNPMLEKGKKENLLLTACGKNQRERFAVYGQFVYYSLSKAEEPHQRSTNHRRCCSSCHRAEAATDGGKQNSRNCRVSDRDQPRNHWWFCLGIRHLSHGCKRENEAEEDIVGTTEVAEVLYSKT